PKRVVVAAVAPRVVAVVAGIVPVGVVSSVGAEPRGRTHNNHFKGRRGPNGLLPKGEIQCH
ncbi:MAG: hypothetical protein QM518_15720, partial [Verrucomicrobiota bacterium]|nr:hypothetical protein [Verrucomicrobiota bacterium]